LFGCSFLHKPCHPAARAHRFLRVRAYEQVQRYRISLREKRVYDVSDRVLFCSDECLVSARLEEVHLRSDSSDPLPPKRSASRYAARLTGHTAFAPSHVYVCGLLFRACPPVALLQQRLWRARSQRERK
jgi:hypothetical protein